MRTGYETPIKLPADREHQRLRIAVLLIIVVAVWLSYQIMLLLWSWLAPGALPSTAQMVSCGGGLVLGLAAAWGVEQWLLRRWHSGVYVILDRDQVCLQRPGEETVCLPLGEQTALYTYHFPLRSYPRGGRERRVPRNWRCLAVQLEEAEKHLEIFALLPPPKASRYTGSEMWEEVRPRDVYEEQKQPRVPVRPAIPDEVLQGEDGRYWRAERQRWENGVELSAPDFEIFIEFIQRQVHGNR